MTTENKFKARLFDLLNHSSHTVIDGYEIDEFNADTSELLRVGCGEDFNWYFKNQEVVVINGHTFATAESGDGNGADEVSIEFFGNRPALLVTDLPEHLRLPRPPQKEIWLTTIKVLSDFDPRMIEASDLVRSAYSGDAYLYTSESTVLPPEAEELQGGVRDFFQLDEES